MIKLAVFDLDGTLLDTLEDLHNAVNYALKKSGLPERNIDETRRFVGNGIKKLVERAAPGDCGEKELQNVYDDFRAYYGLHCADRTCPYPGTPELLRRLRDRGIRIAVVSNKTDGAVKKLCGEMFPGLFDVAAGERDGVRRKPAPDMVEAVLSGLDVQKDEAVYIGDSDVDMDTAANAGLRAVAVLWGFRDKDILSSHGAQIFASDAEELYGILTSL